MRTLTTTIAAPAPFSFDLTVGHQTYYRGSAGADLYAAGAYWRALRSGERVLLVSVRETASDVAPALEVTVTGEAVAAADLEYAESTVARMLGLDADLVGFYELVQGDPVLSTAMDGLYGLRPPRTESVFEALVMAVAAQQISSHIARLIRNDLVATYGTPVEAAGRTLYAFPTPQALLEAGERGLRALRLSGRKVEYIQDIAARALEGSLADSRLGSMDDEAVAKELTKVRGIGRWTAAWVLLRALGRPDVLPAGDLALQRTVSQLYFDGAPLDEEALVRFAEERWRPYRGLATTYLFAYLRRQATAQA